jgi:hypothetical protein
MAILPAFILERIWGAPQGGAVSERERELRRDFDGTRGRLKKSLNAFVNVLRPRLAKWYDKNEVKACMRSTF